MFLMWFISLYCKRKTKLKVITKFNKNKRTCKTKQKYVNKQRNTMTTIFSQQILDGKLLMADIEEKKR